MSLLNLGFGAMTTTKLDPEIAGELNDDVRSVIRIVATVTERERQRRRNASADPGASIGLLGSFSYFDSILWDELLPGCIDECAELAGKKPSEVVQLVMDHCKPNINWALFWFGAYRRVSEQVASNPPPGSGTSDVIRRIEANVRSEMAAKAASFRVQNDPKTLKKQLVKQHWDNWQSTPSMYKNQARFAQIMLDKYGGPEEADLKSQPVIEGWCRDWKKAQSAR